MARSPRTGRSPFARFGFRALVVGLILVVAVGAAIAAGVDVALTGQSFVSSFFPPVAVTDQGERIRDLYGIVFFIAVAIFFLVEGLIIWTVVRYKRRPGDDELPVQTHGNVIAETVWTVVPTIIVAFLFIISWQTLNVVDTVSATPETRIRAVAGQFQWSFDYLADDGKTVLYQQFVPTGEGGGMTVPTGRTIKLDLTSLDVIHAFYVPQFLFKRDVVPGRTNSFEFNVKDSDAGQTFRGQCAELCGAGHRIMLFEVHALTPADFDAWLQARIAEKAAAPTPAPSGAPAPSGQPATGAGPTLMVSAMNVAYEQTTLTAPANTPFKIEFDNKDASVPHNVAIHEGSPTGPELFKGEVFPGPAKKTYDVPALPAGTYAFVCTVHPNMTGTLTVN